jgi:hypothetical protein
MACITGLKKTLNFDNISSGIQLAVAAHFPSGRKRQCSIVKPQAAGIRETSKSTLIDLDKGDLPCRIRH